MGLRVLLPLAILGSFVIALAVAACGPTDYQIVQTETVGVIRTSEASTAIAAQTIQAGGGFDLKSLAGQARATAAANETATAVAKQSGVVAEATPTPAALADTVPGGEPLSGEVLVKILGQGEMSPPVIKILVGTTVKWRNDHGGAHSSTADAESEEQWDSGNMAKRLGQTAPQEFTYTFEKPGRFPYGSKVAGDTSKAVVWVVKK